MASQQLCPGHCLSARYPMVTAKSFVICCLAGMGMSCLWEWSRDTDTAEPTLQTHMVGDASTQELLWNTSSRKRLRKELCW